MDIGRIIREVEIAREIEPETFPFDPDPSTQPAPSREPAEPNRARGRAR
jgi:hypothetical protein